MITTPQVHNKTTWKNYFDDEKKKETARRLKM
jgi:hypothetical protein